MCTIQMGNQHQCFIKFVTCLIFKERKFVIKCNVKLIDTTGSVGLFFAKKSAFGSFDSEINTKTHQIIKDVKFRYEL